MDWSLGKEVNSSLKTNKITDIVMANVGSGWGEQWHCFWPVDVVETEKPVLFADLYRQLHQVMIEKPSNLSAFILDQKRNSR